jgi:hypothetical protein
VPFDRRKLRVEGYIVGWRVGWLSVGRPIMAPCNKGVCIVERKVPPSNISAQVHFANPERKALAIEVSQKAIEVV